MSHRYGMEKLHLAVLNLVGPGSMQSRLKNAMNSHFLHISADTDIPEELVEQYYEIINSPANNEAQSEIDAEHCAQKIVGLHEKIFHLVH